MSRLHLLPEAPSTGPAGMQDKHTLLAGCRWRVNGTVNLHTPLLVLPGMGRANHAD